MCGIVTRSNIQENISVSVKIFSCLRWLIPHHLNKFSMPVMQHSCQVLSVRYVSTAVVCN